MATSAVLDTRREQYLAQIDEILDNYDSISTYGEMRKGFAVMCFAPRAIAAIYRIAGVESAYAREISNFIKIDKCWTMHNIYVIGGALTALRHDVQSGFLQSAQEIAHGEVFADFLEMADYLLSEGYKDAAAVMAGGALESHLRQLSMKNGIEIEVTKNDAVVARKADALNSDLAKAGVYGKLDQKSVTAWLDLRNKAAHAKYEEYSKEQVALMVQGIRDFVLRHPA